MNTEMEFKKQFLHLLDQKIGKSQVLIDELNVQQEYHESVLEKIRLNIVTIFRTMFLHSMDPDPQMVRGLARQVLEEHPEFPERCYHLFIYYLEMIPRTWEMSLSEALEHDDAETCLKEETKLALTREIQSEFESLSRKMRVVS